MANIEEHIYLVMEEESVRLLYTVINMLLSLALFLPTTTTTVIYSFFRY